MPKHERGETILQQLDELAPERCRRLEMEWREEARRRREEKEGRGGGGEGGRRRRRGRRVVDASREVWELTAKKLKESVYGMMSRMVIGGRDREDGVEGAAASRGMGWERPSFSVEGGEEGGGGGMRSCEAERRQPPMAPPPLRRDDNNGKGRPPVGPRGARRPIPPPRVRGEAAQPLGRRARRQTVDETTGPRHGTGFIDGGVGGCEGGCGFAVEEEEDEDMREQAVVEAGQKRHGRGRPGWLRRMFGGGGWFGRDHDDGGGEVEVGEVEGVEEEVEEEEDAHSFVAIRSSFGYEKMLSNRIHRVAR
ncbi:hypothetical protein HDU67_003959, partial [Dinochytrium kinnereticum]